MNLNLTWSPTRLVEPRRRRSHAGERRQVWQVGAPREHPGDLGCRFGADPDAADLQAGRPGHDEARCVEVEVELFSLSHVGENTIPYNEEFRLFLTTKMPNPHYSPEVQVKISLVNFTVTQSGLEEQLLGA